jgi:hypothetical protein
MTYYFEPVIVNRCVPGRYLQFVHVGITFLQDSSAVAELERLKAQLLYWAVVRLTSEVTPYRIARALCQESQRTRSIQRRFLRLRKFAAFGDSHRRKNGIVASCINDIAGRSEFVDEIFNAPIWELASRDKWQLAELGAIRESVQKLGVEIPAEPSDDPEDTLRFWHHLVSAGRYWKPTAWAAANVMFICLRRAQTVGSLLQYGLTYEAMMTTASRAGLRFPGDDVTGAVDQFEARAAQNDVLLIKDFWELFAGFLQNWHSRIRIIDKSDPDLILQSHRLNAAGVRVVWDLVSERARRISAALPPVMTVCGSRPVFVLRYGDCMRAFPADCMPHWLGGLNPIRRSINKRGRLRWPPDRARKFRLCCIK